AFSGKGATPLKSHEVMMTLRGAIWKHLEQEINHARIASQAIGPLAVQRVAATTLVGMPVAGKACLFQFDEQGLPEEATEDLPFIAIGSGQHIADPFLAFLRRVFWPNELPTLADGVLAAIWTVRHAIDTNPGGVGEPIQIITICPKDRDWHAKE